MIKKTKPDETEQDDEKQPDSDSKIEAQRIQLEYGKGKASFWLRGHDGQILIRALAFLTIALGVALCLWCLAILIRAAGATWTSVLGYIAWLICYCFAVWSARS